MGSPEVVNRRYGLYYPFFHVRDERWLKVAALYWPRIVRIVPEDYHLLDSPTVRVLRDKLGFIDRQPPGASVEAVAPRFLDLLANHGESLRDRFPVRMAGVRHAVHFDEMWPSVRSALFDLGLAVPAGSDRDKYMERVYVPRGGWRLEWVAMHEELVSAYTSMLAEDFAAANYLQPTTDQPDAYVITNDWTSERIASALLNASEPGQPRVTEKLAQMLGFLALDLVIPDNLDAVPIQKIVEVRQRYGPEFLAFGAAVDQAAAGLAELAHVRDRSVLEQYLNDAVTSQFSHSLNELRHMIRGLKLDATTMAINVKTELPAGALLAGGAWLAGHPLIAGTTAATIGLLTVHREMRQQRDEALRSTPAASFLLHTQEHLRARGLLDQTLYRLQRFAGITTTAE
jgi:hypothetical protein